MKTKRKKENEKKDKSCRRESEAAPRDLVEEGGPSQNPGPVLTSRANHQLSVP